MLWSVWCMLPSPVRTALRCSIPTPISAYVAHRLRPAAAWDSQYLAGKWDHLADEMPRFAVVGGYCRNFGSVLDIGCGRGLLYDWLTPNNRPYLGLDISATAIAQAQQQPRTGARFQVADMTNFETQERFDVIVFNEVLYYAVSPTAMLRHAACWLQPHGVFLISMYEAEESRRTWQHCDDLQVIDMTRIEHRGTEWTIRLCRPKV